MNILKTELSLKQSFYYYKRSSLIPIITITVLMIGFQNSYSFSILLPPPSQDLTLSIDLPTDPFNSIGYGTTTFNQLAESAASSWNAAGVGLLPDHTFFTKAAPMGKDPCEMDGVNTIAFTTDNCGFEWGDVLAMTIRRWFGPTGVFEVDLMFNANAHWDAYPGPIQVLSSGLQAQDFTRTALHELGHAVGLDHPDDFGQRVPAIMNRRSSDADRLLQDDIDGAHAVRFVPVRKDFDLFINPKNQTISPGETAEFTLSSAVIKSDPGEIDLFTLFGDCPRNSTCGLDTTINNITSATYKVSSTTNTPGGQYPQRIVGSALRVTRIAEAIIKVDPTINSQRSQIVVTAKNHLGLEVAAAKIRLKNQLTNQKFRGITDVNGDYISPPIDSADYKIICKKPPFKKGKALITLTTTSEQTIDCLLGPPLP